MNNTTLFPALQRLAEKENADKQLVEICLQLANRVAYLERYLFSELKGEFKRQPKPIPDDYDTEYTRSAMGLP